MTSNVTAKLSTFLSRAPSEAEKERLLDMLLDGKDQETIAKALGIETKSADPPTPAPTPEPAQPEPTPAPQQPTEPSAELTDTEADRIADKVWSRLEAKYDAKAAEQQTATTKAAEPLQIELATVKADVGEVKALLKAALGEQSAGQVYRASQAGDTIRVDANGQPIVKAQTPQPTTVSTMSDFVLGAQQGGK